MIPQRFIVGKIRGISVEIDRSCLVLVSLLIVFFATQVSHTSLRLDWSRDLVFGIVASALFFLSLFLHEAGHSLVALRFGLPVKSIQFLIFGGLTELGKKPQSAAQELSIALAGPAVSGTLGALFFVASSLVPGTAEWIVFEARLLGQINLLLAAFNLVPAFPLDGGRALRAILWRTSGSYEQGTEQARICARLVVYGLLLVGAGCALLYSFVLGALVVLTGWRLKSMLADRDRESMMDSSPLQPVM